MRYLNTLFLSINGNRLKVKLQICNSNRLNSFVQIPILFTKSNFQKQTVPQLPESGVSENMRGLR